MTRNSRRNLPKQLTSLNHHDTNHKHYDDCSAAAKAMTRMATAAKQQHKQQHDYQSPNPNHNSRPNSETLERGRRRRFRFLVASLGLTVAAVNCYAQATFCIAIVEMVLPADYVFKGESGSQTVRVVASDRQSSSSSSIINGAVEDLEPESLSCPVEYKYRDYYDEWRFPNVSSQISASSSSSSSRGSLVNLLRPPSVSSDDGEPKSSRHHVLDISNRFDWDASRQGLLLGAFAMGMAPLQVLGGRLAELYGAKWVLLAGCLGTALTNLTIPVLAHFSYTLLVINRVAMGVAQAGMEPGLMCLMAQWLAPAETGFFISMLLFALCIGFFLGSLLSSFLLALGLGWPITYYVTGALNLIMGLVWLVYASKGPEESGLISDEELAYIKHEQQQERAKEVLFENQARSDNNSLLVKNDLASQLDGKTTTLSIQGSRSLSASSSSSSCPSRRQGSGEAPWMNILRTPSVWAFIICKISVRWCADVLTIELPTYLANVLHLSIKLNGILNSLSSAFFAIFSFITGYIVNELLKRTHEGAASERERILSANNPTAAPQPTSVMSKTTLRKVFQSVASFGSAIAIFLMTHYDCNIQLSMSMMFVLSACLMMGTGGELQIPYDMTPRYPGTLHGMACTLSVSGWLAPPLIGLILGDQPSSRHRWSIVWYLTASINFIGGLVFVLFADASPRNFDKPPTSPEGYHKKVSQLPPDSCAAGKISLLRQNGSCAAVGPTTTAPPATKAALLRCHGLEPDSTCSGIESRGRGFSSAIMAAQPLFAPATEQRPSNAVKCSSFDGGELLKIRQLEGSLLPSGSQLDSLIAGQLTDVMFPYQQPQPRSDNGFSSPFAWLTGARRSRQRKRQLSGTLMCQRQETSLPSSTAQDSEIGAGKRGKIITRL